MATIITDLDRLRAELDRHREAGKTIVFGNGGFDLLHVGHVRYIAGAKAAGDILLLAVNSDRSVRESKGPGRPVYPLDERLELVAALSDVDYVTCFDDPTVDRLLEALRPDIHAKGTDWSIENLPERETVKRLNIRLVAVGDPKNHSTTEVVSRLQTD